MRLTIFEKFLANLLNAEIINETDLENLTLKTESIIPLIDIFEKIQGKIK